MVGNVEHQPVFRDRQVQVERPGAALDHLEGVFLEQVENGDLALVIDIGREARQARLVDGDIGQPLGSAVRR